jgi:hypothetical protein
MRVAPLLVASLAALAPTDARARRSCVEQSDVVAVGLSTCRRYGWWDAQRVPRYGLDLGTTDLEVGFRAMQLEGRSLRLCVERGKHCDTLQPLADGAFGRWAYAGTAVMRSGLLRLGFLRLGIQIEVGGNGSSGPPVQSDQLLVRRTSMQYLGVAAYLRGGFALGPLALQLDLLIGGSAISFAVDDLTDPSRSLRAKEERFLLSPRVTLQYFLRPDWALDVFAGTDVIHRDEVHAGIGVSWYLGRSYDGLHDRRGQ